MKTTSVAWVYFVLVFCVSVFQLALALGAPWGEYALGGIYPGVLPLEIRIAELFQILILQFFVLIVFAKAKNYFPKLYNVSKKLIWVVVGISLISLIMNLVTPSFYERLIWAPIAAGLLWASFFVAKSN